MGGALRRGAAAVRRARHGRGARRARSRARRSCSCCSTRPSIARRRIPVTSRATRRASARTAASTRTPPPGSSWRWRGWAAATRSVELFHMLNPINHARTAADVARYKTEPYVVAGDVYAPAAARRPRRLELVHRLGRLDVSRRPREHARAAAARRDVQHRPVHPVVVARGTRLSWRVQTTQYLIAVSNPDRQCRGVATATVDGIEANPMAIPLVDDGVTHLVTALDLQQGTTAWMVPVGDGPRNHPHIAHLNLPPLGMETRGNPLVTRTLLFIAQGGGNIGAAPRRRPAAASSCRRPRRASCTPSTRPQGGSSGRRRRRSPGRWLRR